uniref:Uncharacterized protein n=1 Tax=Physcomitrium patens TaxID=3218 RepID=A0A2K1JG62_PHYPA|nr:hypothetical protein PHYPA_017891 [Physcomitrium patens]
MYFTAHRTGSSQKNQLFEQVKRHSESGLLRMSWIGRIEAGGQEFQVLEGSIFEALT